MKRPFTAIALLIALSLTGIIFFQISWIKNKALLKQEQVKQKIAKATRLAADDLAQGGNVYTSAVEVREKIKTAFHEVNMAKMRFEFSLLSLQQSAGLLSDTKYKSNNFEREYWNGTTNYSRIHLITAPGPSVAAKVDVLGTLIIVGLNYKSFALQSLGLSIVLMIFFDSVIVMAFYLVVRTTLRQKQQVSIRTDSINSMARDFETPITTISLAADAMSNEKVLQDKDKIAYFSKIIKEENQRMNRRWKLF